MGIPRTIIKPGDRFTRLTVIRFHHKDDRHRRWWECQCECGETRILHTGNLTSGNTKSCGCLGRDQRAARRLPNNHGEITAVILGYQRHAKRRGIEWGLTREQVAGIIRKPCFYCGSPPSNVQRTKNTIEPLIYSGIDRYDNTKGYEPDNVVPCCSTCNVAKGSMSLEEFSSWAMRLAAMADQWSRLEGEE